MKKKLLGILGLFTAVIMLAGCHKRLYQRPPEPMSQSTSQVSAVTTPTTALSATNLTAGREPAPIEPMEITDDQISMLSSASVDLLKELTEKDPESNTLISPFSIHAALGMTELGANGETLEQMEQIANGGLSKGELSSIIAGLTAKMASSGEVDWNVANSVWFNDDGEVVLDDGFLNDVVTFYDSDVFSAPFDAQTLNDINSWVNDETHEMIPEILDEIPDDAKMYLINAIAFEAEWNEEYEEKQILENRNFRNLDGTDTPVNMMSSKEYGYFELEGGKGFVKPYKGGEYSFVGILPEEGIAPAEYIKMLSGKNADIAKAVRKAGSEEVLVWIPEFTLDYDTELSATYRKMGMELPFDMQNADFTKMMHSASGEDYMIWIGRILHKTHIEVDRKGTKAAAVTAVEMKCESAAMPVDELNIIHLDRPFVYAIVDNETGLPLFLGCQNSME